MIDGSSPRVTSSSSPRNAPPSRMLSRPDRSRSKPAPRVSRPETWPGTSTAPSDGRMMPARTWSSVLLPAPFGPMTARDSPWSTRSETWRSAQNGSDTPRPRICPKRPTDRRLAGESQVVPDAQVVDPDRMLVSRRSDGRRPLGRRHRTLAKFGSRRLKTTVARPRKTMLPMPRIASDSQFGGPGGAVSDAVDDLPIGGEQDRERVRQRDDLDHRVLLDEMQRVEERQAVQAGREEPPQAQHVARDVAEIAEEDVRRRARGSPSRA